MNLASLITIVVLGAGIENLVFSSALGLNKVVLDLSSPRRIVVFGSLFAWLGLWVTLGLNLLEGLFNKQQWDEYLFFIFVILLTILVSLLTNLLLQKTTGQFYPVLRKLIPLTSLNTALLGVLYVSTQTIYTLKRSLFYTAWSAVGYTLALLLIYYGKKRLSLSNVPRAFRGLPALLLYLGIISLALYGLR